MSKITRTVIAAVISAITLSSCNSWLVGDSISWQSGADLTKQAPTLKQDADPGRGAYKRGLSHNNTGWQMIQAHFSDVGPNQWMVVEIGTNDLMEPSTEWTTFIDDVIAATPAGTCLAWVTPYQPTYATQAAQYETLMRSKITALPCYGTVDWDNVARLRTDLVQTDGIHPNTLGRKVYACMVAQVVNNKNRTGNTVWCVNQGDAGLLP
jgi:lysophospholipase L1-like esterase